MKIFLHFRNSALADYEYTHHLQEVEFIKSGSLSTTELDAFVSVLQLAGSKLRPLDRKPAEGSARVPSADKSVASLESMGVRIYGLDEPLVNSSSNDISWENIAGYDQQKRYAEHERA